MTLISPTVPDMRTRTHVADDDPGDEEEEVEVREQPAARGPALARDPEREEAEEAGRVERDGDVRLPMRTLRSAYPHHIGIRESE